jgi:hypothetical protein
MKKLRFGTLGAALGVATLGLLATAPAGAAGLAVDAAVATPVEPVGSEQRMSFAPGTDNATATGAVVRGSADTWVLTASAGQTMDVMVTSFEANSTFDVFSPDGTAMTAPDDRTTWTGVLPADGDYRVVVAPTRGNATYTITVRITGGDEPAPAPQPGEPQRIEFESGRSSAWVSGDVLPATTHRYVVGASAGQTMVVFLDRVLNITATITAPDGTALVEHQTAALVELPVDGDYVIELSTTSSGGPYDLAVWIGTPG